MAAGSAPARRVARARPRETATRSAGRGVGGSPPPPQCGRARHTENAGGADQVVASRGGVDAEEMLRAAEMRAPESETRA